MVLHSEGTRQATRFQFGTARGGGFVREGLFGVLDAYKKLDLSQTLDELGLDDLTPLSALFGPREWRAVHRRDPVGGACGRACQRYHRQGMAVVGQTAQQTHELAEGGQEGMRNAVVLGSPSLGFTSF